MNSSSRNLARLAAVVVLAGLIVAYVAWHKQWIATRPKIAGPECGHNLKQISLAFRMWADAHKGQYPFNVSTNEGGTLELSEKSDGYAANAAVSFRLLGEGDELPTPNVLVCPLDHAKTPAAAFLKLGADNITYRLHAETNVSAANPKEVLVVCPIDGNILHCDGTVSGKNIPPDDPNAMKVK